MQKGLAVIIAPRMTSQPTPVAINTYSFIKEKTLSRAMINKIVRFEGFKEYFCDPFNTLLFVLWVLILIYWMKEVLLA